QANVYVPNGTLWLRQNGQFTGAFLGKWVTLGKGATAEHLSQWSEGSGGSASLPSGGGKRLASLAGPFSLPGDSWALQAATETPTSTIMPTPTGTPKPTFTQAPTATPTAIATQTATPTLMATPEYLSVVIDYTYDPLQRLTAADYSTGEFFHYTYDAVGNRLTQDTLFGTNSYIYDIANRLIDLDGVPYAWDAKGNLLDDGASTNTYDHANRLTAVAQGADNYGYWYNGLGDRLQQTVNGMPTTYSLDINRDLTQVLSDQTNAYLYGAWRIGEEQTGGWQYHLGDALGSVRQLVSAGSAMTIAKGSEPFGPLLWSSGITNSDYGFTGEWTDRTELVYLRTRYYAPQKGRFLTRDVWRASRALSPFSNPYEYAESNPINLTDPTGMFSCSPTPECQDWVIYALVQLDISGGVFSQVVFDAFENLDSTDPSLGVLFVTSGSGFAGFPSTILAPETYLNDSLPPPVSNISLFAHETIHLTQSFAERASVWGEAQAYVFQNKVWRELGGRPPLWLRRIHDLAFDLYSPGFTTRDRATLEDVRQLMLSSSPNYDFLFWQIENPIYKYEPLLPEDWGGC
ncbi:MAG: RHS repeat domain-containing protein, partial [Anaerolineales bacterium]